MLINIVLILNDPIQRQIDLGRWLYSLSSCSSGKNKLPIFSVRLMKG